MSSLLVAASEARRGARIRSLVPVVLAAAVAAAIGGVAVLDVRIAAVAVVVVVGSIAVVDRPTLAGLALVAFVPAGSGLAPGLLVPGVRPSEALVLGLGAAFLLLPLASSRTWDRLDWTVAAYCVGSIAIGAFHELRAGIGAGNWEAVVAPVQYLLLYRIVASTLTDGRARAIAVRLLLAVSIPVSLIGVLQQLDVGPVRSLTVDATESTIFNTWGYQNYPRATSIFPNWHTFGGYLVVIIILGVAWLAVDDGSVPRRLVLVALGAAAGGLALTQTFTSILAVGFGVVLVLNRTRAWGLARWVLVLGAGAVALFGSHLSGRLDQQWASSADGGLLPQTIDYRIEVWTEQYLPLVGRYWPLGFGTGVPPGVDWVYTESGYLTLLLRGGLPLVVLGVVLLVNAYVTADRVEAWRVGADRAVALCALALALALIPMNVVWPYLMNSGLSQGFFVVLGLVRAAGPMTATARAEAG